MAAAVAVLAAGSVGPVAGAQVKVDLVGPGASVYCEGMHDPSGEDNSPDIYGFAKIRLIEDGTADIFQATVVVKGGVPNGTYVVSIVQTLATCDDWLNGYLYTDAEGNGRAVVSEPVDPTAVAATVSVWGGNFPGYGSYRLAQVFVY